MTYSFSRTESTPARVRRMKAGTKTTPMAIMAFCRFGPSMAMIARARMIEGKASSASIVREMNESVQPPK